MPLGGEVGLGPDHIVLDGDPATPPQNWHSSQFSVHVYCSQTVAHLRIALVKVFTGGRVANPRPCNLVNSVPTGRSK